MRNKNKDEQIAGSSGVNFQELERLTDLMTRQCLEEIEYEHAGLRIRLRKAGAGGVVAVRPAATTPEIVVAEPGTPFSAASSGESAGDSAAGAEGARAVDLHMIKSPIVGTYYGSPSPGAPAFVRVGDHVDSSQVLCIIEAMKLMNEIESDIAGEVMRVFVEDGQPVEYGEPLFGIHPNRKK
jgi:acetyl-CoA carboxylase biotin carboxyl carrier protein